ncbi:ComF family protein [Algivirga pacifica]|uniref:ComF family protein n=1 Tax=Algivirga pacifica TaxID=1162670 RepID=A0ABP9D9K0_9BACT
MMCELELPITRYHLVPRGNLVHEKLSLHRLTYGLAYCFFHKEGRVQQLIHHLKYNHKQGIGKWIADRYAAFMIQELEEKFDIVSMVPLHPKKLKKRGYNQVKLFAKTMADHLEVTFLPDILKRTQHTDTQTRKNRKERAANMEGVFQVGTMTTLLDKHILLVDDVLTTGATLSACLTALESAGCTKISVLVMALAR